MSAKQIMFNLKSRGVRLSIIDGGRIHLEPSSRLTDDDLQMIRQHKPAVIELLTALDQARMNTQNAAHESPRALTPKEKADIARFCRSAYGSNDAEVSETIQDAERYPACREYLLTIARSALA